MAEDKNTTVLTPEIQKIWSALEEVPDPEIPVISVVELGVVRAVDKDGEKITISVTPTYTGCPAMRMMEEDIMAKLKEKGYADIQLKTVLSPAWTTDWLTEATKEKLRRYGIAPPEKSTADKNALLGKPREVKCPRCGSAHTSMVSQFGSTACKALWKCEDCMEPFDYFKCI